MSYRPVALPLVFLLANLPCFYAHAADVRVGDAGCKPDPARFDDNYPDMKEWASAGVRGGIPDRGDEKTIKTVKPGDDLQAAIDSAAKAGGGVVLLSDGTYPLNKTLLLRTGVVLRGQDKDGVVLQCEIKSSEPSKKLATVRLTDVKRAGLEDLTIQNGAVSRLGLNAYHEKITGPTDDANGNKDLHSSGVVLERAEDCWIDNCNILHSGSHPFNGQGSHITVRDTLIDGAFNKGDGSDPAGSGNVYFIINNGLLYNCTIKNVRHALVMRDSLSGEPCKYNVILDCNLEGDVDFHANRKDEGHDLFEGVLVHAPGYHGWCAWSYWKKAEIGPETIVYKSLGWGGPTGPGGAGAKDKFGSIDPERVYTYTGVHDPNVLPAVDKPVPHSGTLYAVTAARPNRPDAYGAWPKTPAEALRLIEQRMLKSPLTLTK